MFRELYSDLVFPKPSAPPRPTRGVLVDRALASVNKALLEVGDAAAKTKNVATDERLDTTEDELRSARWQLQQIKVVR